MSAAIDSVSAALRAAERSPEELRALCAEVVDALCALRVADAAARDAVSRLLTLVRSSEAAALVAECGCELVLPLCALVSRRSDASDSAEITLSVLAERCDAREVLVHLSEAFAVHARWSVRRVLVECMGSALLRVGRMRAFLEDFARCVTTALRTSEEDEESDAEESGDDAAPGGERVGVADDAEQATSEADEQEAAFLLQASSVCRQLAARVGDAEGAAYESLCCCLVALLDRVATLRAPLVAMLGHSLSESLGAVERWSRTLAAFAMDDDCQARFEACPYEHLAPRGVALFHYFASVRDARRPIADRADALRLLPSAVVLLQSLSESFAVVALGFELLEHALGALEPQSISSSDLDADVPLLVLVQVLINFVASSDPSSESPLSQAPTRLLRSVFDRCAASALAALAVFVVEQCPVIGAVVLHLDLAHREMAGLLRVDALSGDEPFVAASLGLAALALHRVAAAADDEEVAVLSAPAAGLAKTALLLARKASGAQRGVEALARDRPRAAEARGRAQQRIGAALRELRGAGEAGAAADEGDARLRSVHAVRCEMSLSILAETEALL